MSTLEGTTAVVTGGARGIGQAIATRLAGDGAHVVILDIEPGDDTIERIEEHGGDGFAIETDVSDEAAVEAAFESIDRTVDTVVNNAAYFYPLVPDRKPFWELEVEDWRHVLEINVIGTFIVSKAAVAALPDSGGSIVNISSSTVNAGVPGFLHYVASKAAVMGMTRAMATELGDRGTRINAITPGLTWSEAGQQLDEDYRWEYVEMQSIEEPLRPEHIADAVSFLASPGSELVTGQVLNVDAGVTYY